MAERVVTIEGLNEIVAAFPRSMPSVARSAMQAAVSSMLRDVVRNRMSGQYLGVVTGTARRSVLSGIAEGAESVKGFIGSPLHYVRAHEMGFEGAVNVRPYTRRTSGLQVGRGGKVTKKSAAAFKRAGGSGMAYVRAHKRQMRIRARHFFRDTLLQEAGQLPRLISDAAPFVRRVRRAIEILILEDRVPRASELG